MLYCPPLSSLCEAAVLLSLSRQLQPRAGLFHPLFSLSSSSAHFVSGLTFLSDFCQVSSSSHHELFSGLHFRIFRAVLCFSQSLSCSPPRSLSNSRSSNSTRTLTQFPLNVCKCGPKLPPPPFFLPPKNDFNHLLISPQESNLGN